MGAEKKIRKSKKIFLVFISVFAAFAVVISAAPKLGLHFISWQNVYEVFGVAPERTELYESSVHFINVGEGDCTLIRSDNAYIMIDTGPENYYENISKFLVKNNIETIDYLIITHPHEDHMGGAAKLLKEYKVKNIIMRDLIPEEDMTEDFNIMQATAAEKGVTVTALDTDKEMTIGNADFQFFLPVKQPEDYNEGSIITKITLCGWKILIMGDAGFDAENILMRRLYDVKANILRVGHHGSKYATSAEFLTYVAPQYAIISVGSNKFSHPTDETLERLDDAGVSWFRTDTSNGVSVNFYEDRFEIFTNVN